SLRLLLSPRHDALIVGSGAGGGVAARRGRVARARAREGAAVFARSFQVKLLDNTQGGLSRLQQNLTYASTQPFTTYRFTANSGNSTSLTFYVGNWAGSTGTANFTNISVAAPQNLI